MDRAKTSEERAECLRDAAEASMRSGRLQGAIGYYLRAMRLVPTSAELIDHAATHEHQIALLWQAIGKLAPSRAVPGEAHTTEQFDAERLSQLVK